MARTNKYSSFNLNDIFDKSTSTTSSTSRSPSSPALPHKSYSLSASSRHGGMLVLSRPKPQPQPQPQPHPPPQQQQPQPQPQPQPLPQRQQPALPNSLDFPAISSPVSSKPLASDSLISLRPQGKTGGAAPSFQERDSSKVDVSSPKGNKFVPPHLRPGYVPREVPSVPEFQKPKPGNFNRPGNYSDNTHRPNSGGGYHYHHGSGNGYVVDNGRPMSGGGGGGYNRPRSAHENYHGSVEDGRPMSGGGGGGYNRPGSAHENYHGSGGGYNRPSSAHGNYYGSSNVYVDDGRPNSGGGYDRRMRGGAGAGAHVAAGESESFMMNRPRSSGSRPNSRGC